MTLELVELLGQSSLGGTSLAAAGFFSSRVYKINACTGGLGGGGVNRVIWDRSVHCGV